MMVGGVLVCLWARVGTPPTLFVLRGGFGNFFDANQSSGNTC